MRYKETFANGGMGLPFHVVVQYWDDEGLQAAYFGSWEDAEEFEREIKENEK